MKYIVSRTSIWTDEKPIDNAVQEQVHYFTDRNISIIDDPLSWARFNNMCRNIELINGMYRGIEKDATTVWVAEIDDLSDFVKEHGKIILDVCDNEEGYMSVEIYDYYRE